MVVALAAIAIAIALASGAPSTLFNAFWSAVQSALTF